MALGGALNPQFSGENSSCMMFSDTIGVILLTHERYSQFIKRPIGDARRNQVLPLSAPTAATRSTRRSRRRPPRGSADPSPAQDHGFMFGRSVEDPDGNVWEIMWMDPAALAKSA